MEFNLAFMVWPYGHQDQSGGRHLGIQLVTIENHNIYLFIFLAWSIYDDNKGFLVDSNLAHIIFYCFRQLSNEIFFFYLLVRLRASHKRQQWKCLEADRYVKLEKGLQIVNKAQSRILGQNKNQDKEPTRNGANYVEKPYWVEYFALMCPKFDISHLL